ncbi:MAG: peptide-methionine (S)-S-oxide reductase [Saprospiraceae bacterium]|jgi:peptide-methionine (S)-S-oxide reductase
MDLYTALFALAIFVSCGSTQSQKKPKEQVNLDDLETAYFASGCFWCVEAIYESVEGVGEVVNGYAGGHKVNPTYREVGGGRTGHAEAIEVYYNPELISFKTLVDIYYASQDPTTIGQSPDFGNAYRSIIFYKKDSEKGIAETAKQLLGDSGMYKKPLVTEILPFKKFYDAEDYHQDYERLNPNQPYVRSVSVPRLNRFKAKHPELLKKDH